MLKKTIHGLCQPAAPQSSLHLERFIPESSVQRLRAATAELFERSRSV